MKVSYFNTAKNPNPTRTVSLDSVFKVIKDPPESLIDKIDKVREEQDKGALNRLKVNTLPLITFNGQFNYRSNISLMLPSGVMYVDIDNFTNKEIIKLLPQVKAIWSSCTGTGLGVLVKVDGLNNLNYKPTYEAVIEDFELLGVSVDFLPDIARGCFLSYDREIYIRDTPEVYGTQEEFVYESEESQPIYDRKKLDACAVSLGYASKKYSFVYGQQHNFSVTYFSLCNHFGVDLETAYDFAKRNLYINKDSYENGKRVYKVYSSQHGIKRFK